MYAINTGTWVKASPRAAATHATAANGKPVSAQALRVLVRAGKGVDWGVRLLRIQTGSPPQLYQHPVETTITAVDNVFANQHYDWQDDTLDVAKEAALTLVANLQEQKQNRGIVKGNFRLDTGFENQRTLNAMDHAFLNGQAYPGGGVKLKALHEPTGNMRRVSVDAVLWAEIMVDIGVLFYQANNEAEVLETAIQNAADVAAIRALDIEGGFS